jgi:hypothetical protein
VKPGEPSRLPWEARSLWEGAFSTADWYEWWRSLEWCLPLGVIVMWTAWRQKDVATRVMVVFTVLLFPLAWMVVRYFTFLGFAAAVVAAGLVTQRFRWRLALLVAAVWQLVCLDFKPLARLQPTPSEYRPVVEWLRNNTPTNAVVLASISESPVFLAHTGRPVILHSKFENREIRERYRDFLNSIYGTEDSFCEFARKYSADYFVYDTDFLYGGKDSRRYKADKLGELDANCPAMLFQYRPQRLRHFEPEFVEGRFAVFRVRR